MALFILTVGLLVILMLGIPAAFAMVLSSATLLVFERGIMDVPYPMIAQRVFNGMDSFTLLAVPLFILVGQLMNEAGITDRIFNFARVFVGHLKGGLAYVNVLASVIFAGMSGSAVADAAGLGAIEIKAMTDEGYDVDFSAGITAVSAMIGPVIPPSIPIVLYAVLAGVSVTKLLIAGIIPGLLMAVSLMVYIYYRSMRSDLPAGKRADFSQFRKAVREAFFPLMTPLILIGGILSGIFTSTEAAAVCTLYSTILFLVYNEFDMSKLFSVYKSATISSAAVMFILAAAQVYSTLLIRTRIPVLIAERVMSMTTSYWGVLLLVSGFLLICGCFMSTAVTINILTPVLVPLVTAVGIDPLYFGILMLVILMIGQVTPPFGMVLFAIMGICDIPFRSLVKSALRFSIPILVCVILLMIFPQIVTLLPSFY